MFKCLIGLFLLVFPFSMLPLFKDKRSGFASIFIGIFSFQLFFALILQYVGFFSYGVAIVGNILVDAGISVLLFRSGNYSIQFLDFFKEFRRLKINWFVFAAFIIVFYELFSVHYFYTGIVATQQRNISVTHASYQYPYFSDEYAGIALTEYSIRSHRLPLVNPLDYDVPFTNVLVGFFSVAAEVFLLLGLNPLTAYVPLSIAVGFLSCIFAYIFLRNRNIDPFPASCTVLMLPLIVNSGNLSGMWALLPFNAGLILLLAAFAALPKQLGVKVPLINYRMSLVALLVSLIVYPPMIVFVAPVLFFIFFKSKSFSISIVVLIIVAVIGFVMLTLTGTLSFLIRSNLTGGIPSFSLWVVVPWFALPFSLVGMYACFKRKLYVFTAPVIVGVLYWIVYAYTTHILIIDYSKIVTATSVLIIILAGFGIDLLVKAMPVKTYNTWSIPLRIATLLVFIVIVVSYPSETWAKLGLHVHTTEGNFVINPASPVTAYLTQDDLQLFSNIEGERFIAPSWKGLVIGSVTHNFPLDSKPSTLTESYYSYQDFMALDCANKSRVAAQFSLKYIYSEPFICGNFMFIGSSSEGLYLYKYVGYNI